MLKIKAAWKMNVSNSMYQMHVFSAKVLFRYFQGVMSLSALYRLAAKFPVSFNGNVFPRVFN